MRKIKTSLRLLFTLVFCLVTLATPLLAKGTKVFDQASLLTPEQVKSLEAASTTLAETYQMDIGIITTSDAEGKTAEAYADDFYDYNGFGYGADKDGLLMLIDMDNRRVQISTCGLAIRYLTDTRIDSIVSAVTPYLKNANYYEASTTFLSEVESYFKEGIPSNQYNVNEQGEIDKYNSVPRKPFTNKSGEPLSTESIALSIAASLVAALLITLITRAIINHSYKHPRFTAPETRPSRNSVHYTERTDQFLTTHTTRTRIQTSNSGGGGGGGSSTHSSSSGSSHGGGGGGF